MTSIRNEDNMKMWLVYLLLLWIWYLWLWNSSEQMLLLFSWKLSAKWDGKIMRMHVNPQSQELACSICGISWMTTSKIIILVTIRLSPTVIITWFTYHLNCFARRYPSYWKGPRDRTTSALTLPKLQVRYLSDCLCGNREATKISSGPSTLSDVCSIHTRSRATFISLYFPTGNFGSYLIIAAKNPKRLSPKLLIKNYRNISIKPFLCFYKGNFSPAVPTIAKSDRSESFSLILNMLFQWMIWSIFGSKNTFLFYFKSISLSF